MPSIFLFGIIAAICGVVSGMEETNPPTYEMSSEEYNETSLNSLKPIEKVVNFLLYTRSILEHPEHLKPGHETVLLKKRIKVPFKIYSHGFMESGEGIRPFLLVNNYMRYADVNVIVVDWGKESIDPLYPLVARRTDEVGKYLAKLIEYLVELGAPRENFHLIGFSLGAHVVGAAGKYVQKSFKLPRITGVDPAGPAFHLAGPEKRLDPSDAEFVDVIHTCGHGLGYYHPLGHADFYVNGGTHPQPGCLPVLETVCSHHRAAWLFIESINPAHKYKAFKCDHIPHSKKGCTPTTYSMGNYLDTSARGLFYVETTGFPPYTKKTIQNLLE